MDAFELLARVSHTYRNLSSLALEAWAINESGDEDSASQTRVRTIFKYAAPDRLRCEQGGRRGTVRVVDGVHIHTCSNRGSMARGPRCHSVPVTPVHPLPHVFRPGMPAGSGNEPFLYEAINEQVVMAEVMREENNCRVVSVTYSPPSHSHPAIARMPVLFWIDSETFIVKTFRQEVGLRVPAEDEMNWSTHTLSVEKAAINIALPADTFEFIPPAEAVAVPGKQGFISGGGGTGFVKFADDDPRHIEHRGSHEWEGETLVEHSKWKLRGTTLVFERRTTFSENSEEVQIVDRMKSPADATETSCSLRLT